MTYLCQLAHTQLDKPTRHTNTDIGIEAIRGIFTLLILTVWISFGSLIYICLHTLLNQPTLIDGLLSSAIILLCGWAFFPRLDSPPPDMLCLNESEFPAIYGMVAQVADVLGVPMPKIILTQQYTAGFGRFGWRHVPVLFLGHGLLSLTNRHETTMLLAHELYHAIDSGWGQTRPAKITVGGLRRLLNLLALQPLHKTAEVPLPLRLPLAPLMLLACAFQWCMAYEMRYIEARADEAALVISPSCVMETLLRKSTFQHVPPVQDAYADASPSQKYDAIRDAADDIDPVGFARLWGGVLQAAPHPFDRHPTVAQRIALAQQIGQQRVRPILPMVRYNLAHQELKRWPVWLDEIDKVLSPYLED